jgi:hypothetical protein
MGNFSKTPSEVLLKSVIENYVRVYIEQGVPVLDRDLNLMQDIIWNTLSWVIRDVIGSGVFAGSGGFYIEEAIPAKNDFRILGGSIWINGIQVINGADINYSSQAGVPELRPPRPGDETPRPGDPSLPGLSTPPQPTTTTRTDSVYLDISLAEVSGTQDPELLNSDDVGLQTSVRQKMVWVVRVAEGATSPPSPATGHKHFPLARLVRVSGEERILAKMITDLNKQIFSLQQLDNRIRTVGAPAFAASPNQFWPKTGAAGANITLLGKNFAFGGLNVQFDSISSPGSFRNATIFSGPTDTQVVVKVPLGLTPGPFKITVETIFGTKTSDDIFNAL